MEDETKQIILITGSSSGLGKAFFEFYSRLGHRVITVNRPGSKIPENQIHEESFFLDISCAKEVGSLLEKLEKNGVRPSVFILNAGINRIDNANGLDLNEMKNVFDTNFWGVLSFVSVIQKLKIHGTKIIGIASSSSIVPNPGHIGYYLSKLSLQKVFALLGKTDSLNDYKIVVLGPVFTNISRAYGGPKSFAKILFNKIAVTPDEAAVKISRFIQSNRRVYYYPTVATLVYCLARIVLFFFSGLYQGTKGEKEKSSTKDELRYEN